MSFSLTVNLTGAGAKRGPGGSGEPTVSNAYKVIINSVKGHAKKDSDGSVTSVEFKAALVDGDFAGYVAQMYIGLDTTKEGNRRSWRTALLSAGYTEAEVDGGEITLTPETFEGREAWIFYQARDLNDKGSQSDKYFITPDGAEKILERGVPELAPKQRTEAAVATSNVQVAAAPAPVQPASTIAKPKLGGLKSMLGGAKA